MSDRQRPFPGPETLEPVFQGKKKLVFHAFAALWLLALINFWWWWLDKDHIIHLSRFIVMTLALLWLTMLPAYFIVLFARAKRVRKDAPLAAGRVAMIVTKAPSEPFAVVKRTLLAMLAQKDVPAYDVWLADEDPSSEVVDWCREHGVQISTRHGVTAYHRKEWPRRTRCKEGNLAYFYDHYGYERYDFVSQFDADHVPQPGYLKAILQAFSHPSVGYVSAPSICDANASSSWAARGRLFTEATLHGCLQLGYNAGWAPLCIGSHYAVRTQALRDIGGLGPELAEDHSTTLMMNAAGWRGLHAIDAIAHGDGPETFADLAVQEFQWSRSLMTILLRYTPQVLTKLPPRLRFQFLFSQVWYPLFQSFMLLTFIMPLVALASGLPFANVTWPEFMIHSLPIAGVLIPFAIFWRASGTYRPADAKLLSWEGIAFFLLRWPWAAAGCMLAVRDHLTRDFVDFRITPKGKAGSRAFPFRIVAPYVLLASVSTLIIAMTELGARHGQGSAQGFYIFAMMDVSIYLGGCMLIMVQHMRENGVTALSALRPLLLTLAAFAITAYSAIQAFLPVAPLAVASLTTGQSFVRLTQTQFMAAGAGSGRLATQKFKLQWGDGAARSLALFAPKESRT